MTLRHANLPSRKRSAFTLMEMLVVVAIIVVLAGGGSLVYLRYIENAKRDSAKKGIATLDTAVTTFYVDFGQYPGSLEQLTFMDPDTRTKAILERAAIFDPWGNLYQYNLNDLHPQTGKPRIYTQGPNGMYIANFYD